MSDLLPRHPTLLVISADHSGEHTSKQRMIAMPCGMYENSSSGRVGVMLATPLHLCLLQSECLINFNTVD